MDKNGCRLCPRECGADREGGERGICGAAGEIIVSRAAPHMWEEPPISGVRGSGTLFFGGCPLGCVYCQNRSISRGNLGKSVTPEQLCDIILRLAESGVHNINLVTPTHFSDALIPVLQKVKPQLQIPIVYNCGGYEKVDSLRSLEGLIDIYLPDFKYFSPELAALYSSAPDYPSVAEAALVEMLRQVGEIQFDGEGIMKKGMIVRHLVLPSHRADSSALLQRLAQIIPADKIRLSLMRQYTPEFALDTPHKNLHRRLTTFEYQSVMDVALSLGFEGYFQSAESADTSFTPDFDFTGVSFN